MKTKSARTEAGTAIVLVISILATLVVIVGVAADYTLHINRNVQRGNTLESAIAIADGCLEYNFALWRQACRNPIAGPTPATNQLNTLTLPTQTEFPNVPNFTATRNDYDPNSNMTVQQCKVVAVDPAWNVDSTLWTPPGNDNMPPPAEIGSGTVKYNYLATAYVTLPSLGPQGSVVARVQRVFQEQQDSPLNYAIFYIDPLEIHPGAPFNVTGWVHTNSDLYTAHNLLNFAEKATFSGDWSIGFRPGDTAHNGEVPQSPTGVTPIFELNINRPILTLRPSIPRIQITPDIVN